MVDGRSMIGGKDAVRHARVGRQQRQELIPQFREAIEILSAMRGFAGPTAMPELDFDQLPADVRTFLGAKGRRKVFNPRSAPRTTFLFERFARGVRPLLE
jgi:hypothetical protein